MNYLSNEELAERVRVLEEFGGNETRAAKHLNIARSSLQSSIKRAARLGLTGHSMGGATAPGFSITRTTTLYGPDGAVKGQWVQERADTEKRELLLESIREALGWHADAVRPELLPAPLKGTTIPTHATIYQLADHHLGMYSWAQETGENYDVTIAGSLLREAATKLVAKTPPSGTGVLLNLGDFFHADTNAARTPRSGNELDTDGRFAKVLQMGVDLKLYFIDLMLQKHDRVIVVVIGGNHDPYASLALRVALGAFYHNDPRVEVVQSPEPFWWWEFGMNFIAATHGDQVKPEDFPGVMAALKPDIWGRTTHRYAYFGHVHHKSKGGGEKNGVIWETFQTLAPKDAWHYSKGYVSGRSITAITLDAAGGEDSRDIVHVKGATR